MGATIMKMPWQMRRNDFVPFEDTLPQRVSATIEAASASEADIHFASWKNRSLETEPPLVISHPMGSWTLAYDCLCQLRRLRIAELQRFEDPNPLLVDKYVAWYQAGFCPPPIRVTEGRYQSLLISDGHHRVAALEKLGIPYVDTWLSLSLYETLQNARPWARAANYDEVVLLAIRNEIQVTADVLEDALMPDYGFILGDLRDNQFWVTRFSGCEPGRHANDIETLARMGVIDYRYDNGTYIVKLSDLGKELVARLELAHA
jgi:hypothetical protein